MRFCIHYSVYRYYLPKKGSPEEGHICRSLLSGHEPFPIIEKIKDKPDKGNLFCYKLVPQTKMEAHLASWEASATVIEERLFGPATLKSGVTVYPCSQSGCWVFCSSQICRRKYLPGDPADNDSSEKDHIYYHKAWHPECSSCNEVYNIFVMYRPMIWDEKRNVFVKTGVLEHHYSYERKPKEEKLKCNICAEVFTTVASQVRHYKSVHTKEVYHCIQCEAVFNREDKLKTHVYETHESIMKCESCKKVFSSEKNLQRHLNARLDNEEPKYVCSKCQKLFCTMNLLQNHKRKHKYTCDRCDEIFSTKFNLTVHKDKKSLKCDQCNRAFCTNKKLIFHKKITHGEVFECEKCGKFFMTRFNMNRHMNTIH